METPASHNS